MTAQVEASMENLLYEVFMLLQDHYSSEGSALPAHQSLSGEEGELIEELRMIPALQTKLVPEGQVHF
jgi:hypothetical protein